MTRFAPTDEELSGVEIGDDDAFAALPGAVLDQLLDQPDRLATLLGHHVVSGSVSGGGSYIAGTGDEVTVTDTDANEWRSPIVRQRSPSTTC